MASDLRCHGNAEIGRIKDQLRLIPYTLHGEGFWFDVLFLLNWLEFRATFILCKNDISSKPICPSYFQILHTCLLDMIKIY